ncbi:lipase family protein [Williamsia maris]|uniref:lipase family protein n=1 Tax=Williamsia maris TaxID=72806 RepID=UPI0020A3408E|nr:lipase family protein [Williamsia maris]
MLTTVLLLSGCTRDTSTPDTDSALGDAAPGTVLQSENASDRYPTLAALTDGITAIRYRSTAGTSDAATEVSGVVFVPRGTPPVGGWPLASIAHPTTGVTGDCGPSDFPGLLGSAGTVATFLTNGFVVAFTDYEGLGAPGAHPYLEPKAAAHNVIDVVRAARNVEPRSSTRWVTYGVSQGGQAAWAANELSADYGSGLRLLGSLSIVPPTDLSPLVDAMESGTLTTNQKIELPLVLTGLQVTHPELRLDDYLRGSMRSALSVFLTCAGDQTVLKQTIASRSPRSDVEPVDDAAAQRLRGWLRDAALPGERAPAPMFVAYGTADDVVLPAWTVAALRRACALGDVVQVVPAPGQGHGTLDLGAVPAEWILDRLAGRAAPDSCP